MMYAVLSGVRVVVGRLAVAGGDAPACSAPRSERRARETARERLARGIAQQQARAEILEK